MVACDLHPEYLTSKWAANQPLPVEHVQHHHAHVAAVMGENNLDEAVCGIAFDGTGYGPDGAIWGGEVLLANRTTYERFANFAYVPMPGGAAAIKHPLRMAYGVLWAFDLLEHPAAQDVIEALGDAAPVCEQMVERALNTPMTSSVGRLFDAASAMLGVCVEPTYEGEGAILLEAAMTGGRAQPDDEGYHLGVVKNVATHDSTALDTSVVLVDAAPVFEALLDDKAAGVPVCAYRPAVPRCLRGRRRPGGAARGHDVRRFGRHAFRRRVHEPLPDGARGIALGERWIFGGD